MTTIKLIGDQFAQTARKPTPTDSKMSPLKTLLADHHTHCDDLFAQCEQAANDNDWPACIDHSTRFFAAMESHFRAEEDTLFPAFEQATGMNAGPTEVMRSEHTQMRTLLASLLEAAQAKSEADFFGASETLLVFMEQHNRKEEGILYPLCDEHIAEAGSLAERLKPTLAS